MTNTSATGGFLQPGGTTPAPTAPLTDDAFDALIQAMVVGITGLSGSLVRPRWQPEPPPTPDVLTNWCAIGVTNLETEGNAAIVHHSDVDGWDEFRQSESVEILATFYGPNCYSNALLFRDGLYVPQNRETLFANFIGLVDTGSLQQVPELENNRWRKRVDVTIRLRRMVTRAYPVENILEAVGTVQNDQGQSENFDSNNHS